MPRCLAQWTQQKIISWASTPWPITRQLQWAHCRRCCRSSRRLALSAPERGDWFRPARITPPAGECAGHFTNQTVGTGVICTPSRHGDITPQGYLA